MPILISKKANFSEKKVIKVKGKHCIMKKRSMIQKEIIILNMCVPNNRILQHEAEADRTSRRNRRIHSFIGDLNTPLYRSDQIQQAENQ